MGTTKTHEMPKAGISPHRNPLFKRLPDQYYAYALQWCAYPRWTLEETANLLAGCVPHREMFLKGAEHREIDDDVLAVENRIRAALGKELKVVSSKKYFEKTYIDSTNIVEWALSASITIPNALLKAYRETRLHRETHGYTTPSMQALDWVVREFWEQADLRDPPSEGEIVNALLQRHPELTPTECQKIEYIARHPAARDASEHD